VHEVLILIGSPECARLHAFKPATCSFRRSLFQQALAFNFDLNIHTVRSSISELIFYFAHWKIIIFERFGRVRTVSHEPDIVSKQEQVL
jgi:hypothetical protein